MLCTLCTSSTRSAMSTYGCLLFLYGLILMSCDVSRARKVPIPEFSNAYTAQGTLYIPYAEIKEPFYAWHDGKSGSSRIDYYGGMAKTFQLSRKGPFGTSIKIVPVTTETVTNHETCLQVNGSLFSKIQPQTVIPDITGMKYMGIDFINEVNCTKWQLKEEFGDKYNKYTLWVTYKTSSKNSSIKDPIPIRYEMKGFNSLLGSHYDHYYLNYDQYSPETPNEDVFEIGSNTTCQSFPGPGEDHIYNFNPMKEFIDNHQDHMNSEFEKFKKFHGKNYKNDKDHEDRKKLFRDNLRFIHSKNRANLGYNLKVNHLADNSREEIKALCGRKHSEGYNGGLPFPYNNTQEMLKDIPDTIDWRILGAVTPVKDQSVCGSCWSFGSTGAIEGAYFLKYKKLKRFSEQALIDCSWAFGNNGCDGGEDFRSYQWMMKHGGLPTEDDYGNYLGQDGYCHINATPLIAPIKGFVNVTPNKIDALKIAIAKHGPISIAIDASHRTFSFYSDGVYYDKLCESAVDKLDHAVLAVGYGSINGKGYWLVKNSWSNYWGNDGYILMAQQDNNCGVLTAPTYVTM